MKIYGLNINKPLLKGPGKLTLKRLKPLLDSRLVMTRKQVLDKLSPYGLKPDNGYADAQLKTMGLRGLIPFDPVIVANKHGSRGVLRLVNRATQSVLYLTEEVNRVVAKLDEQARRKDQDSRKRGTRKVNAGKPRKNTGTEEYVTKKDLNEALGKFAALLRATPKELGNALVNG